jgi:CrcB protein
VTGAAWLAFLLAAAIGAPARYLVDRLVQERTESLFPRGTWVVNVSGCFVLGVISGLGLYHDLGVTTRTVIGTGCMGAYTTFSTFSFETMRLAEQGAIGVAVKNVVASFVAGLAAAAAGLSMAALL